MNNGQETKVLTRFTAHPLSFLPTYLEFKFFYFTFIRYPGLKKALVSSFSKIIVRLL